MMSDPANSQEKLQRIDLIIQEIEASGDPRLRACAVELTSLLMEIHGAGLAKIVEALRESGPPGEALVEQFTREPMIAGLLLLYGLHPTPLSVRVQQALDKVRPLMRSHGGEVTLLEVSEERVRLRLEGACHGCPSSRQTMHNAIEQAMHEFAPDIAELHVEGVTAPDSDSKPAAGFVSWEQLVGGHA